MRTPEELKDLYTIAKPCCVNDAPDAHTVWMQIGNQLFCIDGYQDTLKEAEWMRLMLGISLATLIQEESKKP